MLTEASALLALFTTAYPEIWAYLQIPAGYTGCTGKPSLSRSLEAQGDYAYGMTSHSGVLGCSSLLQLAIVLQEELGCLLHRCTRPCMLLKLVPARHHPHTQALRQSDATARGTVETVCGRDVQQANARQGSYLDI